MQFWFRNDTSAIKVINPMLLQWLNPTNVCILVPGTVILWICGKRRRKKRGKRRPLCLLPIAVELVRQANRLYIQLCKCWRQALVSVSASNRKRLLNDFVSKRPLVDLSIWRLHPYIYLFLLFCHCLCLSLYIYIYIYIYYIAYSDLDYFIY